MPYHILLVDDDPAFRQEFRESLEEHHIRVIEASSGAMALETLRKPNEIDLVLLDVMMPGMRGTEVLKEMKRLSPELAIVIITGFSSADVAIDALKGRADDYLEKPVDMGRAKEVLEKFLKRKDDGDDVGSMDISGKVDRVKRFAQRNFDKSISLDDAARSVGVSPKYLSRIFKDEAGVGFSEYKVQVKIERAREWLVQTGYNVNQISEKLGYENVESFIRAFKKITGLTPSGYRKSVKRGE